MKIKALPHSRDRAAARPDVALSLADDGFELPRQHGADRGPIFSRDNPRFLQQLGFNFECDISFHGGTYLRAALFYVL